MARYRTTFVANRTPEAAFEYLSDFSNCRFWDPSVTEAERLDEAPVALGTRFLVHATFLRRVLPLTYEITVFEPASRVVLEAEIPLGRSVDEITFVANTPTGCTVTYDANLALAGGARLLDPVMALVFRRTGDQARAGLVRALG